MQTHIIEVTNGKKNWGKFLIGVFDKEEISQESIIDPGRSLLRTIGWDLTRTVWVLDLQTHEGASFALGGRAHADLEKHRVWVCPLFEPFLEWLYKQERMNVMELRLPKHVDLPDADFEMYGHRRSGPEKDEDA